MRCMIVRITSSATTDLAELFAQCLVKESVKERIADVVNQIDMVEKQIDGDFLVWKFRPKMFVHGLQDIQSYTRYERQHKHNSYQHEHPRTPMSSEMLPHIWNRRFKNFFWNYEKLLRIFSVGVSGTLKKVEFFEGIDSSFPWEGGASLRNGESRPKLSLVAFCLVWALPLSEGGSQSMESR